MMTSLKTFYALIKRDMKVFRWVFFDRLINACIWVIINGFISQYIFSKMGMQSGYGSFMACGIIISNGIFDILGNTSRLISDIEGDRTIDYYLTLPLPHWLGITRIALVNAFQSMCVSIAMFPLAKLLLGSNFSLSSIVWIKFFTIFIVAHLFYGYSSLVIASYMQNLWGIENIWSRFIYPVWVVGGFQFSWKTLHSVAPTFSYFNLFNPLVMCFEGFRGAVFGQEGYVSFWICFLSLVGWTIIFGYIGTKRMMRRLDCV